MTTRSSPSGSRASCTRAGVRRGRVRGTRRSRAGCARCARRRSPRSGKSPHPLRGWRRNRSLSRANVTPQTLTSGASIVRPRCVTRNCSRLADDRIACHLEDRCLGRECAGRRVGMSRNERSGRAEAAVGRHARAARRAAERDRMPDAEVGPEQARLERGAERASARGRRCRARLRRGCARRRDP